MKRNPLETLGAQNSDQQKAVERKEKGANGFKESYNTALQLRNLQKGWGEHESSESFEVLTSDIARRSEGLAEATLRGEGKPDLASRPDIITNILRNIEIVKEQLIRFETRAELPAISSVRHRLEALAKNLRGEDAIKILKSAIELNYYYRGFMDANSLLLTKADEASGKVD